MHPFDYNRATSVEETLLQLGQPGLRLLAGGTSLVDLMKLGVERPSSLLDITALKMEEVTLEGSGLRIGALATNTDAAQHNLVKMHANAVSKAILAGASGQIRNVATIGGNLLQRTRCTYFRGTDWRCNKRNPGAGCSAIDGLHAGHAVLGTSASCNATHPSDLAVALLALDAQIHVRSMHEARQISFDEFYVPPGATPQLEHVLAQDELITHISLPLRDSTLRSDYLKLRGRASYEFATVSVAAALRMEKGCVAEIAVALGGVGTVPWRIRAAESVLRDQPLTPERVARFCDALFASSTATTQLGYKLDMARAAVHRILGALQ